MRKFCAFVLAGVIGFGVVGCGEEKKNPPATPPAAPTAPAAGKADEKKPDAAPAPAGDKKEEPKK